MKLSMKRVFAMSGWTFAGLLAVMPAAALAGHEGEALSPMLWAQTVGYPRESLSARLERIEKAYKVDIVFDYAATSAVTVPASQKVSADRDIANCVGSAGFDYRRLAADRFSVAQREGASVQQAKPAKGRGTLRGSVVDAEGSPIVGATVRIAGTQMGTVTDVNGGFSLKNLPTGNYTVEVSCISYATMRVKDVDIRAGKVRPLDVILQNADKQLGEVVVTATYHNANANALYARQKNMVAMSDGISADLIKKTSDNNVAQVLKRVSGVTVDNGKYVIVRGLGERYNNVELNGSSLPSTEPNRRIFSFDIIPSGLIDNVTIAKTFTPDLPGEFTGGLVEVNTLSVPAERILSVSAGTGFNTVSTGKEFLSPNRLNGDYFLGNKRDWYGKAYDPNMLINANGGQMSYSDLNEEQRKALNANDAKVPNRWAFAKFKGAPTQNYAITYGQPFELKSGDKLGLILSATYRHEETTDDLQDGFFVSYGDSLVTGNRYKFVTAVGAVANLGWERPGQKVTWRNLFNNRFTNTSLERVVYRQSNTVPNVLEWSNSPLINRLWQTQLEGDHQLPLGLKLTWNADYSKLDRTSPDDRYATALIHSDPRQSKDYMVDWVIPEAQHLDEGFLMYGKLNEKKKNIGLNLEYPFTVQGNLQKLKVGYLGTFRNADYKQDYRQVQYTVDNFSIAGQTIDKVFDPSQFADGKLFIRPAGSIKNYYHGKQNVNSAFLMGEFTFFQKLHVIGGVRMEKGDMNVLTSAYNKNREFIDTTLVNKKTDFLPAATLVYNITDNMNFRAAYSRTLARPDFRELAVSQYYNVDDRIQINMLGGLRQSYIKNVDVRWEWYPQPGEVVSLSAFYKKFKDPVELINMPHVNNDGGYDAYMFNLRGATAKGVELNVRKSFGFIAPGTFLKDLYFSGNATLLKGDVDYSIWQLVDEMLGTHYNDGAYENSKRNRPLQGLSPYTVNAGLSYQGKVFGANVNYSTSGRKLLNAGSYEKYDEYEAPRHIIDLQLSARFLQGALEVKANAGDLLGSVYRVYRNCGRDIKKGEDNTEPDKAYTDRTSLGMDYDEGDWIISQYKRGTTYSFSVSYKF